MTLLETIFLGFALSLDSFAIAICISLCANEQDVKRVYRLLLITATFHLLMPLIGYFMAEEATIYFAGYDNWIAFALLASLGGKMVYESLERSKNSCCANRSINILTLKSTILVALALSIDAVTAGFSLGIQQLNIINGHELGSMLLAGGIFGLCAFFIPLLGYKIGRRLDISFGDKAEIFGGIVLILIGIKTLIY